MFALDIKHLSKTYSNQLTALNDVNLSVQEGDFYGLLGPNGAGKSTLIGIITGLVNKSSGSVSVFGHNVSESPVQAKTCLGLVPQEFNFNIFEKVINIVVNQAGYYGVSRKQAMVRAERYLSELGLWEKRHEPARNLSGGMKRRLMIARALLHEPKLLILDEPTAGVDIEIRRSMWAFLEEINRQGVTVILTTHYLEEAESLCRNIGIIDRGKIIENTSKRQLLEKLNQETIVVDLNKPLDAVASIEHFDIRQIDATSLEISFCHDQNLNHLFEQLSALNIQVNSMRNKSNRLEELFIRMVSNGEDK